MKRALILVEGQTEERFVKDILGPSLDNLGIWLTPVILSTKRLKDGTKFRGGVSTYGKFREDVLRLIHGSGGALVTTMVDYYGLPNDFPGMNSRPNGDAFSRVRHVEHAISTNIGNAHFIPFLMLHEFEAVLFSDQQSVPAVLAAEQRPEALEFANLCGRYSNPEEINDGPLTAPSKRITALFPEFRKLLHGPTAAGRIGIASIRSRCSKFAEWLSLIEAYARPP